MPSGYPGSRQKLRCNQCKEMFFPKGGHLNAMFCSRKCKHSFAKGKPIAVNLMGLRHVSQKTKRKFSPCALCNSPIESWVGINPKYCSHCWKNRKPKVKTLCLYCGDTFLKYEIAPQKYCSRKCYGNHLKILRQGENSHLWKGGATRKSKTLRSRAEYKKWRQQVYLRDNHTCQECGYKPERKNTGTLHAHHIKSFSQNESLRTDISNGITLCELCHQKKHKHKLHSFSKSILKAKVA